MAGQPKSEYGIEPTPVSALTTWSLRIDVNVIMGRVERASGVTSRRSARLHPARGRRIAPGSFEGGKSSAGPLSPQVCERDANEDAPDRTDAANRRFGRSSREMLGHLRRTFWRLFCAQTPEPG